MTNDETDEKEPMVAYKGAVGSYLISKRKGVEDMDKRFMSVQELKEFFDVSQGQVYKILRKKGFPAIKLGKSYRIDRMKLENWLDKNYVTDID